MSTDIKRGDLVEARDAFDRWHRMVALSGVEPTHLDGRKVHDFPVIWLLTAGQHRIPWPAEDVRPAPAAVPDDPAWMQREIR